MRIERALKIQTSMRINVDSVYSVAKIAGMTSLEINSAINAHWKYYPNAPRWIHAYIEGYKYAMNNELYDYWLIHGGYIDGIFYSTDRREESYYQKHGIEPVRFSQEATRTGHYWKLKAQEGHGIYTRDAIKPLI